VQAEGQRDNVADSYFHNFVNAPQNGLGKKYRKIADGKKASLYRELRYERKTLKSKTKTSSKI
jgi:hypothetical protein